MFDQARVTTPFHPKLGRRKLAELIDSGEGVTIEFKRFFSSPEKIAKELIAFANTKGGTILFGVDDDKTVVGLHSEKSEEIEIEHTAQFLCDPPIPVDIQIVQWSNGKDVIAAIVDESIHKPHVMVEYDASGKRLTNVKQIAYVRVGDKSLQASREVMKVMQSRRPGAPPLRIAIGHNERQLFEYLEKHERITVDEFANLVNISRRRASKILVDLVRSGTVLIHTIETREFFTLAE